MIDTSMIDWMCQNMYRKKKIEIEELEKCDNWLNINGLYRNENMIQVLQNHF
jgi:hypothetical protein